MKRRRFLQGLVAVPAGPSLLAQQAAPNAADDNPKVEVSVADVAAEPVLRFFNTQHFTALRKVSDILMPAGNGVPGALDAHAPEFLDFLISDSPADRQQIYRSGLDALNAQAKKRFNKPFAETDASQAEQLLTPLHDAWTYEPPADPLARFLRTAKEDIRTATLNSREWSLAAASTGRRTGTGLYWLPID